MEQGVPEKYVRLVKDTYENARTQVKTRMGVTGKITVRVGLHQGSSLSRGRGIKEQPLVYAVCRRYSDVQY